MVALRKESVDRNTTLPVLFMKKNVSLSARRAWIEISVCFNVIVHSFVALRKESVDRNATPVRSQYSHRRSLSARRAWIEITSDVSESESLAEVALRKESVDRNFDVSLNYKEVLCRSPQGERG